MQPNLVDFGEFESRLVDGRAVVVGAGGEVVDHGAAVARRPGVPEELDGLAGDDGDVGFSWFAGFVADDVGGLVGVGGDLVVVLVSLKSMLCYTTISLVRWLEKTYEARVKSRRRPTSYCRRVCLVVVVEVPARVELAAGLDQVDEAVGRSPRDQLDDGAKGGEARQRGVHDRCGWKEVVRDRPGWMSEFE
jgi:hypothetical protein